MPKGILKSVAIQPELDEKMKVYCKKYGLNRSEFIRSAVIERLEKNKEEKHD